MKSATFTKPTLQIRFFDESDLIQIVEAALEGVNSTFTDKKQYDDIIDNQTRSLKEIFKEDDYKLKYLGDNLNTHEFIITNGKHSIEIVMNETLFRVNFNVK